MTGVPSHRFPLDERTTLLIEARGSRGAFALACVLGLRYVPITVERVFARAEWTEILARIRVYHMHSHLAGLPIYRQHCGCAITILSCRACVYDDAPQPHTGHLEVKLCAGHHLPATLDTDGCPLSNRVVIGFTEER